MTVPGRAVRHYLDAPAPRATRHRRREHLDHPGVSASDRLGADRICSYLDPLVRGSEGLRKELRARLRYEPGTGVWLAVAGVVLIATLALATFVARATGGGAPWTPASAIPVMIGVQVITGAVGEELGWRGYQPGGVLRARLGRRSTSRELASGPAGGLPHTGQELVQILRGSGQLVDVQVRIFREPRRPDTDLSRTEGPRRNSTDD